MLEIQEIETGVPTTSQLQKNQEILAANQQKIVDYINEKVTGSAGQ